MTKIIKQLVIFLLWVNSIDVHAVNINLEIEVPVEIQSEFLENPGIRNSLLGSFHNAIAFLENYVPSVMRPNDYVISLKITSAASKDSVMEVDQATGQITLSWPRFKKIYPLEGIATDDSINNHENQVGKVIFESLLVHELTHKIHYRAYVDSAGYWNPDIKLVQNKELREYVAIVAECYYLIKALGLNWLYANYADNYLNGAAQSIPPMGASLIGKKYSNKQGERRWAIFAATIYLSDCWKYDSDLKKVLIPWDRKVIFSCLDAKNNTLGNLPKEWLTQSLQSTKFIAFTLANREITSIDQWGIYGQIILTDIISQARKHIRSEVFQLPIEEFVENQIYELAGPTTLDINSYYNLLEGWFLLKFHHFGGGFSERKVNMYKAVE